MNWEGGATELHFAAQAGKVGEIERLVRSGADVNVLSDSNCTPLKYACAEPFPAAVQKLLELGADVHLADDRGFTPLHCAAGHGFWPEALEIARMLLDDGADVNVVAASFGFVPLHETSGVEMIDLLLEHGADPSIRSAKGQTPFEYMIEDEKHSEAEHLAKRLKERGLIE